MSPHDRLDDWREGLISLSRNGYNFISYAAFNLIRGTDVSGIDHEVRFHMICSALTRQDADAVRVYINYWSNAVKVGEMKKEIYRWIPGDHFYVLDRKFGTLEEAKSYLKIQGYGFSRLVERYVYGND